MKELKLDAWTKILLHISRNEDNTITNIQLGTRGSYSNTFNICTILQRKELIKNDKQGRKQNIELTEKGEQVVKHLIGINELIGGTQNE